MILVTGATGRIGGAACLALDSAGVPFRALVRSADKFAFGERGGVESCVADLAIRADVGRALDGVTRALLVTANSERQAELERSFCEQAAAAGVSHIVKVSSMEAGPDATAAFPRIHYESEQFIKSLDLSWTMVQPNFFMQNLLMYAHSISNEGTFALPLGNAKTGIVDARDVGAVCATVLREQGHEDRTYQVTGSELLTFSEVATEMSKALGREIRYVDQPAEEFRAFLGQVIPSTWHVDAVCDLFASIAGGALEKTSSCVNDVLGREPTSVAAFTADHVSAF